MYNWLSCWLVYTVSYGATLSLLDKAEDWLVRQTLQPLPQGHPPSDDGAIALGAFVVILLGIAATCGHCLAR